MRGERQGFRLRPFGERKAQIKGEQLKTRHSPDPLAAVDCFHLAEIEMRLVFADYFPGIGRGVQIKIPLPAAIKNSLSGVCTERITNIYPCRLLYYYKAS